MLLAETLHRNRCGADRQLLHAMSLATSATAWRVSRAISSRPSEKELVGALKVSENASGSLFELRHNTNCRFITEFSDIVANLNLEVGVASNPVMS